MGICRRVLEWRKSDDFGWVYEGKANRIGLNIILLVKVLASKPPKQSHRTSKARRFCEVLQALIKWSQKRRFTKVMESKVQKMKKSTDVAEENDGVTAEKIKFPLYVFSRDNENGRYLIQVG